MVSTTAYIGIVILVVGLGFGMYGAVSPVSNASSQTVTLANQSIHVDPNDYASLNLLLGQGQKAQLSVAIENTTIFQFYVMNSAQYYTYYGCGPWCHSAANISGVGAVPPQNLTTLVNITTITPSSPYSGTFTAPANGTYYFIFDSTIGPSWATYIGQNSPGYTYVNFTSTTSEVVATHAANWPIAGTGMALLLVGGVVATATWEKKTPTK